MADILKLILPYLCKKKINNQDTKLRILVWILVRVAFC